MVSFEQSGPEIHSHVLCSVGALFYIEVYDFLLIDLHVFSQHLTFQNMDVAHTA